MNRSFFVKECLFCDGIMTDFVVEIPRRMLLGRKKIRLESSVEGENLQVSGDNQLLCLVEPIGCTLSSSGEGPVALQAALVS